MQPNTGSVPPPPSPSSKNVPVPSKEKVFLISVVPSPFSKIWKFISPENVPAVVNCRAKTRPSSSGKPFAEPFKTYQAPPVWVLISMSCPSIADPDWKEATNGWEASSTVLMATSSPVFWLSMPIVIQLSASSVGTKAKNAGLIPEATVEPNGSLKNPSEVENDMGSPSFP